MDHKHCVTEREIGEIDFVISEELAVAVAEGGQNTRSWIHHRKAVEGPEETPGGDRRELLQSFYSKDLVIDDMDATDEDVETIYYEVWVEVREFWHRHEVLERRQADGFFQRRLEGPRNAS